jgi:hypothetical protein
MLTSTAVFALLALVTPSLAAVTPTSPDSTTVVKIGDTLTALWDKDTTGTWTDLEIQLMTGPNEAVSSSPWSGVEKSTDCVGRWSRYQVRLSHRAVV